MKGYVVMEKGFEYNDEINSSTDGGFPKKIYFNVDAVKSAVKNLNLEKLKSESITDYAYDLEDVLSVDVEKFEEFLKRVDENHGGKEPKKNSWIDDTYMIHPKATNEELAEFEKMITLSFYEYVEVEVDVESFRDNQINQVFG